MHLILPTKGQLSNRDRIIFGRRGIYQRGTTVHYKCKWMINVLITCMWFWFGNAVNIFSNTGVYFLKGKCKAISSFDLGFRLALFLHC